MPSQCSITTTVPGRPLDEKMSWKPPVNSRATLLALPLELKQQIYSELFHLPTESTRPCETIDYWTKRNTGCRCGEKFSIVSKEIYKDTRALFYNCANFVFMTPEACQRFIPSIGAYCLEVGSLEITYTNTVHESSLLQVIFEPFRASRMLVHLALHVRAREEGPYQNLPIYIPSQTAVDAATLWDLQFRPMHHPLADLKALRKLTIRGHPGVGEMEEVLFRASKNVESLAKSQRRCQRVVATWTSERVLSYSIESIPDEKEEYPVSEPQSPADSQPEGVEYSFDGIPW